MKKRIIYFLLAILLCQNIIAQNYMATYAEFGTLNSGEGVLTFNANTWLYEMSYSEEIKVSTPDISISDNDKVPEKLKFELFNYYSLDTKEYYWEMNAATENVVIKDSLQQIDWKIFNDSTKTIGGFQCTKAEGKLGGWDVEAWFSVDVPVPCGPWRFWGLPGLIVNASSKDGDIDIQMTSLKQTEQSPVLPDIHDKKIIKKNEFMPLLKSNAQKLARVMSNMQDRDGVMSVNVKVDQRDKCF